MPSWIEVISHFSECTFPDDLDCPEIIEPELGTTQPKEGRLLFPKRMQLSLLPFLSHRVICLQPPLKFDASIQMIRTSRLYALESTSTPLIALDGRLDGDLVKVFELELSSLRLRDGLLRETCCCAIEVDIIWRLGGVAARIWGICGLLLRHVASGISGACRELLSWLGEMRHFSRRGEILYECR